MTGSLLLASTSPYRAALLKRLRIPFDCARPVQDERPLPQEGASALARRLAAGKAASLRDSHPQSAILGGDQTAECRGRLIGKAESLAQAREQLAWCSGHTVTFYTAISLDLPLHWGNSASQRSVQTDCCITEVRFRQLEENEISSYLAQEPALDCAGSFKVEGLRITLCESVQSVDPTALEGIPLITTAHLLRTAGFALP